MEAQTQLLRAELVQDAAHLHGSDAVDTTVSKDALRSCSHSFSGLVSGTAVGWPFDGSSKPKGGAYTRQETYEVVTGRRVLNRFRDKKGQKSEMHTRKRLSNRRMVSLCTCQRCQAACAVERCWRGLLGRRLALRVRTERDAARTIQTGARRWLERRQIAAIEIQSVWRGYMARVHLCGSDKCPVVATTSPVDDELASICATDETPEPQMEPEPLVEFESPRKEPGPEEFSRLRPYYSHAHDDREFNDDETIQGQLFLNGVSVAVQHAAVPLLVELSAEALHRDRERARQQKAYVAPVTMLKLAGAVRGDPLTRSDVFWARERDFARGHPVSFEAAAHEWAPTRTSFQRSTSDPQLLSKLLLRRRSSRNANPRAAKMRKSRERVRGSSRRPASAPSSRVVKAFAAREARRPMV